MSSPATSSRFSQHIVHQYDLVRKMIGALAEDFSDEEATRSVEGQKPLVWYLGHIAVTENYLLSLYANAESVISAEHVKSYGRGSDGHADFSGASKQQMLDLLATLRERMTGLLSSLGPEDLDRKAEGEVRHPLFAALGSAITLVVAHNGYHAGQVGMLRRAMGKDPLFG